MRKRVGFITSNPLFRTGFSTNAKAILSLLWKEDKYDLFLLAQGTGFDDPNLQKMPWKSEGVFKRGSFNEDLFRKDSGYQRLVSYGNLRVEQFIVENKLDCLIHIEDGWSSDVNFYLDNKTWWPHFKNNFLQWTTADSLPLMDIFKRWANECANLWFWSSFAERVLKSENPEKYKNVKTVFGALNLEDYHPISNRKKLELREKFNIPKDTKIFIQLGRNQLRKLYPQTIEAFSIFKRKNPEHKAKLLFHCSWSENGGWTLEKLIKDYNLDKEDVLTTYYCSKCSDYEIKPFAGEDINCRFCNSEKSQKTAGVASTISNETLSEIYGIADASLSIFTSGGMEYTNPQSLLCGLPLLCTEYSCGEDFVKNEFVFKLDGVHTFECGSGFEKHVPNLNTIVKFFKSICLMKEDRIKEIGLKGREWALRYFNPKIAIKELENFIDNCPPIEWDYKCEFIAKNPNYQFREDIEDDVLWIKDLYSNILKMEVTDEDSGLATWRNSLANNVPRKEIYDYFINVARQENAKNNPIRLNDLFDDNGNKKICFVVPGSLGDAFICTSLFKSIKELYPKSDLYVATSPQYFNVFDGNKYVYKVIPYHPDMENELLMTGAGVHEGVVDILYTPTFPTQRQLNYISKDKIALNLKNE